MAAEDHKPVSESTGEHPELKRTLGPVGLIGLGIGAIIGAGIFSITGTAAAEHAGPAIVLSFVLACIGCVFAGLCYSELASMIPQSGSAYTYTYAAFGSFAGWLIGWDLTLEYGVAAATVAVSWGGYFKGFLADAGIVFPAYLTTAPIGTDSEGHMIATGSLINLPAMGIVLFLTALLSVGIRESASVNGLMVILKVAIILAVIGFGLPLIAPANLDPFIPENTGKFGEFGWSGILAGAGVIFFAYIGFDSVSVAAQEAKNPQRDLPIGILGSLAFCTVLYILMSLTMTGLAPYQTLKVDNPVSVAIASGGDSLQWLLPWVNLGAITGLSTVILVSLYGQTRIFYAMSRDGFLPKIFARVHSKYNTPAQSTWVIGIFVSMIAGVFPLSVLGELVSVGTLLAFMFVCTAVIILRQTRPKVRRPFKVPFYPLTPILGIVVCGAMVYPLLEESWLRLVGWLAIGVVIYVVYGARHAKKPTWSLEDAPEEKS